MGAYTTPSVAELTTLLEATPENVEALLEAADDITKYAEDHTHG